MRTRMLLGLSLLLVLEGCSSSQQNGSLQGPIPATPGMTGNPPPVGPGYPATMTGPNGMPSNGTQPLTYAPNRVQPMGNPQGFQMNGNRPAPLVGMNRPQTPYNSLVPPPASMDSQLAIDPILAQATMVGNNVTASRSEKPTSEQPKGEFVQVGAIVAKPLEQHSDLLYAGTAKFVPPPPTLKDLKDVKDLKEPQPTTTMVTTPPTPMPQPASAQGEANPAGVPVMKLVGTRKFNLTFAMQDAPAGSTVEVWATQDQKIWKKFQATFQPPSLLSVETPGDGMFGLLLLIKTTANAVRTPKAGEMPTCWISVDTTKPTIELIGVDLSLTSKSPALVVRWKAQDRNFGPRPVTISYSETGEGPWIPLAGNVTNVGRYEIPVVPTLPRKMLVRIEATDIAGNVGTAQTPTPIRIDLPWPPNQTATAELQPVSATAPKPAPIAVPVPAEVPRPVPTISIVDIAPGN